MISGNYQVQGYTLVRDEKSQRFVYECNAKQIGIDGITRKCSRRYRANRIPNVCKHIFSIPVQENEPPEATKEESEQQEPFNVITKQLAIMTSKLNISLRQATSIEMKKLINCAIEVGINMQSNRTNTKPISFNYAIGRKQLRSQIINESKIQEEANLRSLKQVGFVVAAIDNGTINGRHFLFVCLLNPCAGLYPIYYDSRTERNFFIEDFAQFGQNLYFDLKEKNILLVGFVGDNLPSQIGGLGHWKNGSIQSQSDTPDIRSLLYVPCCCHVLNLVIKDLERESVEFSCLKGELDSLSVLLRKKEVVKALKRKMPDIPETRWVYIYDTAYWVMKHSDEINMYLTSNEIPNSILNIIEGDIYLSEYRKNGIPKYISEAVDLLEPVKKLMCAFESNHISLYNVFPLLNYTLEMYQNMITNCFTNYFNKALHTMRMLIVNRFQKTARFDLIITSFALTYEGRKFFREFCSKSDPPLTEEFSDQENDDSQSDLYPEDTDIEYSSEIEDDDIFDDTNQITIEDIMESSSEDYDDDIDSENPNDGNKSNRSSETEEEEISFGLSINTLLDTISNVAERLGFDSEAIENVRATFLDWIIGPSRCQKHLNLLKNSPWRYWKLMNFERQLNGLPSIALRLISLPASEACCERMISENRRIIDSYRMNSSDELIKARNTLRTNK